MKKYRKKPIVVEAEQWDGEVNKIVKRYHGDITKECDVCYKSLFTHGRVKTLEGEHIVCHGDWIIKGIKGEYYPCKPDIFKLTYEEV